MRVSERARAERIARVLVSDLVEEWGDQIRIGLEKDDLFDRMGAQIERSRVFFLARVTEDLEGRERIFDWAVVNGLLVRNRAVHGYVL